MTTENRGHMLVCIIKLCFTKLALYAQQQGSQQQQQQQSQRLLHSSPRLIFILTGLLLTV